MSVLRTHVCMEGHVQTKWTVSRASVQEVSRGHGVRRGRLRVPCVRMSHVGGVESASRTTPQVNLAASVNRASSSQVIQVSVAVSHAHIVGHYITGGHVPLSVGSLPLSVGSLYHWGSLCPYYWGHSLISEGHSALITGVTVLSVRVTLPLSLGITPLSVRVTLPLSLGITPLSVRVTLPLSLGSLSYQWGSLCPYHWGSLPYQWGSLCPYHWGSLPYQWGSLCPYHWGSLPYQWGSLCPYQWGSLSYQWGHYISKGHYALITGVTPLSVRVTLPLSVGVTLLSVGSLYQQGSVCPYQWGHCPCQWGHYITEGHYALISGVIAPVSGVTLPPVNYG